MKRIKNVKAVKCLTILPASQLAEAISFKMMLAQHSAVFQHKHCTTMAGKSLQTNIFILGCFEHILLDPLNLHYTQVAFPVMKHPASQAFTLQSISPRIQKRQLYYHQYPQYSTLNYEQTIIKMPFSMSLW